MEALKVLPPLAGRLARNGGQGSIEETEIFILRPAKLGSDLVGERRFSVGTGGQRGTCARGPGKVDSGTECRREWEKGNNCGAPGKGQARPGPGPGGQGHSQGKGWAARDTAREGGIQEEALYTTPREFPVHGNSRVTAPRPPLCYGVFVFQINSGPCF